MPGFPGTYIQVKTINIALTNNFSQATCHFASNLFSTFKKRALAVRFKTTSIVLKRL